MAVNYLIIIFSILTLLTSVASLLKNDDWWIRIFDFPRVQIVVLTLSVFLAFLFIFDSSSYWYYIIAALFIASLTYQITEIYPYTWLAKKQVIKQKSRGPESQIALLVANVLTPNRNVASLIKIIQKKKPDVVLTLETDQWWENQLQPLEEEYRFTVKMPLDNLYGMHLYSKLPLVNPQIKFLVEDDIPSIHTGVQLRSGDIIKLYCVHPTPPSPTESETSTERDAELLIVGKEVKASGETSIVMGDLNDVAWSRTTKLFQKISGLLDPRKGRGFFSTFHAKYPLMRWPLDHIFHSNEFTLVSMERLPYFGSDHFPIYMALNLEPKAEKHQPEPIADAEDKKWAEEKIERALSEEEPKE